MAKPRYWIPLLFGASAAVAGLGGGVIGTVLASNPESSNASTLAQDLLGSEQAFPPSDNWPGETSRPVRDVLFEDVQEEWTAAPTPSRSRQFETWTSDTPVTEARSRSDSEEVSDVADVAADSELMIRSDINLGEDLAWEDAPAAVTAGQLLSEGEPEDASPVTTTVETIKPSAAHVDTRIDDSGAIRIEPSAEAFEDSTRSKVDRIDKGNSSIF